VHPDTTVRTALTLTSEGLSPTQIGRRLGVPKSTVQYWCRGGRSPARRRPRPATCPRCHGLPLDEVEYAYLLGSYLGDGHINTPVRSVAALAVSCADDWPGVRAEVAKAMSAVMPSATVHLVARTGCHAVTSYTDHWLCLFPQHGPGKKHTRDIVLAPWQAAIVAEHPGRFLRGLFHSDGCRVTNWATKRTESGVRRYEYPRYHFSNRSEDILGLCTHALDLLGIPWRRSRHDMLSVSTRAGVAALDLVVGPKC